MGFHVLTVCTPEMILTHSLTHVFHTEYMSLLRLFERPQQPMRFVILIILFREPSSLTQCSRLWSDGDSIPVRSLRPMITAQNDVSSPPKKREKEIRLIHDCLSGAVMIIFSF